MFDCKPACCGSSDPVSDTVKVDASKFAAGKENAKPTQLQNKEAEDRKRAQEEARLQQQRAEERRQVEEEARRRRQEEDARRRREEEEARQAAQEAAEREAAEKAAAARAAAEARAEEQQRLQAEQELMEAQERARQEREAAERAAQLEAQKKEEERAAQEKVDAWCKTNGFADMATQKKSFMSGTRFPIHDAVTKNDAEIVGLMLQLGVDKSVKNSKGKTASDIAHKLNKNHSMDAVISKLNGNFP